MLMQPTWTFFPSLMKYLRGVSEVSCSQGREGRKNEFSLRFRVNLQLVQTLNSTVFLLSMFWRFSQINASSTVWVTEHFILINMEEFSFCLNGCWLYSVIKHRSPELALQKHLWRQRHETRSLNLFYLKSTEFILY